MKDFLFITLLLVTAYSCNQSQSNSTPSAQSTSTPSPVKNEPQDYSYGKLFRDVENKFRIQYPDNWELVKGEATHTVVKFINRDSSMSLSVNVMDNDGSAMDKQLSETELDNYKSQMTSSLIAANKSPISLTAENGFLDNHNAVIVTYKFIFRQVDVEYPFQFYQIQGVRDGKIYTITLSVIDKYYTASFKNYINNYLYSFRFE